MLKNKSFYYTSNKTKQISHTKFNLAIRLEKLPLYHNSQTSSQYPENNFRALNATVLHVYILSINLTNQSIPRKIKLFHLCKTFSFFSFFLFSHLTKLLQSSAQTNRELKHVHLRLQIQKISGDTTEFILIFRKIFSADFQQSKQNYLKFKKTIN